MRLHACWLALRAVGLVLGLGLIVVAIGAAADAKAPLLPDADYAKMVKRHVKGIQDALKGDPEDKDVEKARTSAVLIAAFAQADLNGKDAQQRATVRDAALKMADLVKAKKYAEASKMAGTLATLPADPKAKKEKVKLMDAYITYPEVMHGFRHLGEGGYGTFGHLQRIQTKQYSVLPREELNEAFILEAYQVAVSADLANAHQHKLRPKEWAQYTDEMRTYASELAQVLKDKDAKAAPPVVSKLTTTCFNCHKMLKVKNTGN